MMNTAVILGLVRDRIEALVPYDQASPDDVFRATIGTDTTTQGSRVVLLSGSVGYRPPGRSHGCETWTTSIEITAFYANLPTEAGSDTVYQRALRDGEDLVADLYVWASTTSGIHSIAPSLGRVDDAGNGELQVSIAAEITFERS